MRLDVCEDSLGLRDALLKLRALLRHADTLGKLRDKFQALLQALGEWFLGRHAEPAKLVEAGQFHGRLRVVGFGGIGEVGEVARAVIFVRARVDRRTIGRAPAEPAKFGEEFQLARLVVAALSLRTAGTLWLVSGSVHCHLRRLVRRGSSARVAVDSGPLSAPP